MRKFGLLLADPHAGHKLGLLAPDTLLFDEDAQGQRRTYSPRLTAVQEWLWQMFLQHLTSLATVVRDAPVVAFLLGDATHGDKYPQQLVSTRRADQIAIAAQALTPLFHMFDVRSMRIALGTAAHNWGEGSTELLLAQLLAAQHPSVDLAPVAHGLADLAGVSLDYAHHGPPVGSRNWLRGNVLRIYTQSLMLDELLMHNEPPRIMARGHVHSYKRETVRVQANGQEYTTEALLLPPLCGMGEHARQVTQSRHLLTCGFVAVEVVDGELSKVSRFLETQDLRTRETL